MNTLKRPRLSTSSWSLHRTIGITYPDAPGKSNGKPELTYGQGTLPLLEIPVRLAEMGIHTMEICHFHLPKHDTAYLNDLRAALDSAGVQLFSLLIDDGDITHPLNAARDLEWIMGWLDIAGQLGAERARVIAGKSQNDEGAMGRSRDGMANLAAYAQARSVRLMTENWFGVLGAPQAVHSLLGGLDGAVGLCADFGNWGGPSKYDDLASIFPLAESCHAKCSFSAPQIPNRDDYTHCLDLTRQAGFGGPYTLIYDGPGDDEWAGLRLEREMVLPYLS